MTDVDPVRSSVTGEPSGPSGRSPRPGRRARRRRRAAASGARTFIEWIVLIVAALAVAFVIKTFLFQAFYIPSESMVPTLQVGDRVLVNKLSYKLHDVHRGDIVVFEAPPEAETGDIKDLVKRVIGLPGDTVEARDDAGQVCAGSTRVIGICRVYVNGKAIDESYLPQGTTTTNLPPTEVPPGRMFVMGDNRSASKDSRVFGTVPESTIVGRTFVRIWPLSHLGLL